MLRKGGRCGRGICVRVLHQTVWSQYAGREDGSGRLCRSVGRPDDGEDDGGGTAHHAKERLPVVSSG